MIGVAARGLDFDGPLQQGDRRVGTAGIPQGLLCLGEEGRGRCRHGRRRGMSRSDGSTRLPIRIFRQRPIRRNLGLTEGRRVVRRPASEEALHALLRGLQSGSNWEVVRRFTHGAAVRRPASRARPYNDAEQGHEE